MAFTPSVTVVIPVYNEASTIHSNISSISEQIKNILSGATVIVVDDGSSDGTKQALLKLGHESNSVKVIINEEHKGKGYALLTGAKAAQSDIVCFLDCDLSIDTKYVKALVDKIEEGFDVAIASRFTRDGVNEAIFTRSFVSFVFRIMRRMIVGLPKIADTQCGCKAFKREVLATTFQRTVIDGFCYDLELLYLLHKADYKIAEIPIKIQAQTLRKSRVSVVNESWRTFRDMLLIKMHHG